MSGSFLRGALTAGLLGGALGFLSGQLLSGVEQSGNMSRSMFELRRSWLDLRDTIFEGLNLDEHLESLADYIDNTLIPRINNLFEALNEAGEQGGFLNELQNFQRIIQQEDQFVPPGQGPPGVLQFQPGREPEFLREATPEQIQQYAPDGPGLPGPNLPDLSSFGGIFDFLTRPSFGIDLIGPIRGAEPTGAQPSGNAGQPNVTVNFYGDVFDPVELNSRIERSVVRAWNTPRNIGFG